MTLGGPDSLADGWLGCPYEKEVAKLQMRSANAAKTLLGVIERDVIDSNYEFGDELLCLLFVLIIFWFEETLQFIGLGSQRNPYSGRMIEADSRSIHIVLWC
jgi:hypothetical protein